MGNLGEYFSKDKNNIVELIDHKSTTEQFPREYLGCSQIGEECHRKLWYYFRHVKKSTIDGRLNRLFKVGHDAESKMIKSLESVGIECWDTLDAQAGFEGVSGHFRGHGDGACRNVPGAEKTDHLIEFKTSNLKGFKEMQKKGVKESKPTHYYQMIIYAYYAKLTKMLYMMYCKDDSSYYIERLHADNKCAKELIRKAEQIITCEDVEEFSRIGSNSPSFFKCKWCDYSDVCFGNEKPEVTCRTCTSVSLLDDGKWGCGIRKDYVLSIQEQHDACPNYNVLECFGD